MKTEKFTYNLTVLCENAFVNVYKIKTCKG